MADSTTVTARVPRKLLAQLDKLSKQENRSRSFLIGSAMAHYIENRRAFRAAVREGLADIAAGRVVADEDVGRWIDSWGTENELPMPVPKTTVKRRASRVVRKVA